MSSGKQLKRKSIPVLEALSGSRVKSRLLHFLYVDADSDALFTERGLARLAGVPVGSAHKALVQLFEAQLVERVPTHHGPKYRAPFGNSRLGPLFQLVRQDSELVQLLKRAVRRCKSVDYACVFGSFASGGAEHGRIDVLILENTNQRLDVIVELCHVGDRIGREMEPHCYGTHEFSTLIETGEPSAIGILVGPRIELKGHLPRSASAVRCASA